MTSDQIKQRTERCNVINMMRNVIGQDPLELRNILRVTWGEVERITEKTRQNYNKTIKERRI